MKESCVAIVVILALVSILLKTKENSFICNRQTEQCEEDPTNNRGYDTLEEVHIDHEDVDKNGLVLYQEEMDVLIMYPGKTKTWVR